MCVLNIRRIEILGDQLKMAEIKNINNHETYNLYKDRYLIRYKCKVFEHNYSI